MSTHTPDEATVHDEGDSYERKVDVLRENLAGYELTDEDLAVLETDTEQKPVQRAALPVLAVLGRPNVGKSSLVNRIVGKRVAVVQDTPGVTRDRVAYPASWNGRQFTLLDTGGWETDVAGIDAAVARQAEAAIDAADAVALVVDATVGITTTDEQMVRLLRAANKPVILVANKVDSAVQESDAAVLWGLGLGEPYAVSALHGRGTGDLLDRIVDVLPEHSAVAGTAPQGGPHRIALVGRPNVGKSSLLNKLTGSERVVVDEQAGTTRDPVDETVWLDGTPWTFVDTAGIRRKINQTRGADYYASLRTAAALEQAELGLVLIDASQPVTEQDIRVVQHVADAGRALVVVANKWDMVDEWRRRDLESELEREMVQLTWAERVNLSALTGWHTNRLTRAMGRALESWQTRIPTGKLNAFLGEVTAAHPHPVRGGKQPRILFATQPSARPPRFVLFASGFLEAGYRRFIENQLRENFGFTGTPIEISVRVRERRARR
ncbi:MAG: ribosome biogenesis GTPase Der [Ancrocorticia sp.]|jgi:GTP-binding protein|nr:ribosome biogenesis GTPase Der [Ancrocorticia sp.]MCI1895501.1 ribosome biogenesis GTPase Der [Ancrocorticia sp.]MCI1932174.1 ribosome biogenesis GTPase Der [Ancrocorticia sp.]MCI1963534.1 ribosome biogenesis GTPase Der [Ancrocorticia sp.]MCI2002715.1 ribosome biogenesis GTPase Der [Ancrocorticia sp.]